MGSYKAVFCILFVFNIMKQANSTTYFGNNQSFLEVPSDIPVNTVIVELAYNLITQIKQGDFQTLTSLKRLYLQMNKISQVSPLGSRCVKLESLSLTNNSITSIPVDMFQGCDRLKSVGLAYNNLTSIDWIKHLGSSMKKIYISGNQISLLTPNHFVNLTGLEYLSAFDNGLTHIDTSFLRFLPNLNKIGLSNNLLSYIGNPYPWCNGVSCTNLQIMAGGNPLKCDSSFCWNKHYGEIKLSRDGCFSKPWKSVTIADLNCNGMLH